MSSYLFSASIARLGALSLALSFFGETKTLEKGLDRGGFYESEGRYLGARITSVETDFGRWMVFGRCEPLDLRLGEVEHFVKI